MLLPACGGDDDATRAGPEIHQAPGTENEAITLQVSSTFRPPFENHEGYDFVIGGIGDGVGVGQRLDLAQVSNPPLPTDHEIRTVVPLGGWLGFNGAFWHYVRSEYQSGTFTMAFGRKVTAPRHEAHSFLVQVGDMIWVRGRSHLLRIHEIRPPQAVVSVSGAGEFINAEVGRAISMPDGTQLKILDVQAAKDDLPAYAEIVRLPDASAAADNLRHLPLR